MARDSNALLKLKPFVNTAEENSPMKLVTKAKELGLLSSSTDLERCRKYFSKVKNKGSLKTIMVIPDLHIPFSSDQYMEFAIALRDKHKPDIVIFIGDILDNHFASYHETELDALSADEEIKKTLQIVNKWHHEFPGAHVIEGNHDRMITRKAKTAKIPRQWLKTYNEVLNTPTWKWHKELLLNKVLYLHGEGVTARKTAMLRHVSVVQGHKHQECYVQYLNNRGTWAAQIGVGIDRESYALRYSKIDPREYTEGLLIIKNNVPTYIPRFPKSIS